MKIEYFLADARNKQFRESGWSHSEKDYIWSLGHDSRLRLPRPRVGLKLRLTVQATPFPSDGSQGVRMLIDGRLVFEGVLERDGVLVTEPYVVGPSEKVDLVVDFFFSNPGRPVDVDATSRDDRLLAICVHRVDVDVWEGVEVSAAPLGRQNNLLNQSQAIVSALQGRRVQAMADDVAVFRHGGGDPYTPAPLIRRYVSGYASQAQNIRNEFCDYIVSRLGEGEASRKFFRGNFPAPELVERFCPELADNLFRPAESSEGLKVIPILPASACQFANAPALPRPINMVLEAGLRPPLNLYRADGAVAYVSPHGHQVYSQDLSTAWISGSPRGLGREIASQPCFASPRAIIIVSDWAASGNFVHFLLDNITRLFHVWSRAPDLALDALFVFNGCPTDYHRDILNLVRTIYPIQDDQILFPATDMNIVSERGIHWFSDSYENYLHPAQLVAPESVQFLKTLAGVLPKSKSKAKRIYISRNDASARRLKNEAELVDRLVQTFGFASVELARLPAREQIDLVRGSEVIVAPHGMGLVHTALHDGPLAVLELFSPTLGSDAFAAIAMARGFTYDFVLGTEVDADKRDFVVETAAVLSVLKSWGLDRD